MDTAHVERIFARRWPAGQLVATTEQLQDAGLTTRLLQAGIERQVVHRLRRGVYVPMHAWQGKTPWVRNRLALMGHVAQSKELPVYSHFSAARLHQLNTWNSSSLIHVSGGYSASGSKLPADVVLHKLDIQEPDIEVRYLPGVGAVRLTTLRRTVLDCATVAPLAQAVVIGDSALNKGLQLAELERALVVAAGRRGVQRARRAVAAMNALSESAGESRTRLIIGELPIEQPELQVWLECSTGRFRVDFVWRSCRLILEFDGNTKYFDFPLPTDRALVEERERENALIEQGWRFIRVKWAHLEQPETLKARIMRAYLAASAPTT